MLPTFLEFDCKLRARRAQFNGRLLVPLPKQQAYPVILHVVAALMVVGLAADLLLRPVSERFWLAEAQRPAEEVHTKSMMNTSRHTTSPFVIAAAWLFFCVPAARAIYNRLLNALKRFQ